MFFSRYPSQFREIAIDPQISTADGENSTQRQMKFPKLDQLFPKNLTKYHKREQIFTDYRSNL